MEYIFSPDDIREQFLAFMREKNVYPANQRDTYLILDDRIHRYQIEGHKNGSTNGAYCIHTDGLPAGFLQDWSNPDAKYKWSMKGFKRSELPDFDINKWKEEQAKKEAKLKEQEAEATDRAYEYYEQISNKVTWHEYLRKKEVNAYNIKIDESMNQLVIPLRDIMGRFKAVQTINNDGVKRFSSGTSIKGAFFSIGVLNMKFDSNDNTPILAAEGYATTAKIFQLTGLPCVAAICCNNLEPVIKSLREKLPSHPVVIMADNDIDTFKKRGFNPGINEAEKLVKNGLAVGYIAPPFNPDNPEGSDWDDYAIKFGDKAAYEAIFEGRNGLKILFMNEKDREKYLNHLDIVGLLKKLDPSIKLPPQEFIGGIFPRGFVSSVVAPPGTGKTVFMQKTVSDLTIGGTFFDGIAENEPPRKCLIFAAEAGYELLLRRGASFKWPINPDRAIVADQFTYERNEKSLMLDSQEGIENIKDIINTVKPDIVFFDTFPSFHEKDENKASEIKPIIRQLTDIARNFNLAVVLVNHSRKRSSKDRALSLNQDDVIGSSIFNRLVGLIIGIEPISDEEKILQVRTLKTWFRTFSPFTYKIGEDLYGHSVIETNLAPDDNGSSSRVAVWNYLADNFKAGEWFSASQIILSEISENISERLLRKIITEFVNTEKLIKRGLRNKTEYSLA